jgi:hypothetical protein
MALLHNLYHSLNITKNGQINEDEMGRILSIKPTEGHRNI